MAAVDVLLPTYNRLLSFTMTLSGVASQDFTDLCVVVADQSDEPVQEHATVQALGRIIEARGGTVVWCHRDPVWGIAEQRDFLLKQATAPWVLYLDDDVWMAPWVVGKLAAVLHEQGCAFAGAFPTQLSYRDDHRPSDERVEFWEGPVQPEVVEPGSTEWDRASLHSAANLYHVGQRLPPGDLRLYKVAWVASCIMYNREMLERVGGFEFWSRLPRYHSGEEVLVQNLLMRRWGGCAMMPSGTYFSEMPSTVLNDDGTVDGHALDLLPEMVARYVPDGKVREEA